MRDPEVTECLSEVIEGLWVHLQSLPEPPRHLHRIILDLITELYAHRPQE